MAPLYMPLARPALGELTVRACERLREGWAAAVRTGSLGQDAAAGSEAKREQLQRRHERVQEGWPVAARTALELLERIQPRDLKPDVNSPRPSRGSSRLREIELTQCA